MKISKYLFLALVLCSIAGFPYKASSVDRIPFYATNDSSEDLDTFCCSGPWLRVNGGNIPSGAVDDNFYSVIVDIFSPYGSWTCGCTNIGDLFVECLGCGANGSGEPINFDLKKQDIAVYFTISADGAISLSKKTSGLSTTETQLGGESDTSTTQANLGDDNNRPRRDRDTWSIQGTEGETVVITLEEDPSAGHGGEQATLMLRDGRSTIETSTDVLPIEITTTLPSDGEYQLVVQQHNIPENVRFRGRYSLSVKSSLGNVQDIKPSEDVEQF